VIRPRAWLRSAYLIRKVEPNLILVHYWSPWLAAALGTILPRVRSRKENTRIIAIVHRQCLETNPVKKFFVKYFFGAVDAFITLSKTVYEDMQQMVHQKPVELIYHPLHMMFGNKVSKVDGRSYLKLDPKQPVILFFGIVRPYKGLDLLLQAMAKEEVRALHLRLIIAGEFSEGEEETREMIRRLDLENHVILVNEFIPTSEVKYYFSAADLVIQPYKTASRSGITQIAYQFERPMLVTNVGRVSEIVPHMKVGYVVDPNAEAIATSIVDFYKNKREKEFDRNLKEEKKRFSWDHMLNGIEELYKRISTPL
jgi:D-inositol-3-phosphate glycosyltransferase